MSKQTDEDKENIDEEVEIKETTKMIIEPKQEQIKTSEKNKILEHYQNLEESDYKIYNRLELIEVMKKITNGKKKIKIQKLI